METMYGLLKNGDKKAFEAFFRDHKDAIYRYAHLHLKDGDAAVDVVQDVFLRLWNKIADIDPGQNAKAYLYAIARNAVFDELRKKAQFSGFAARAAAEQTPQTDDNEERQHYNDLKRLYHEAIGKLPGKRQEIYRLSKQEYLTNEKIAKALNISVNTVRDQLVKGNSYVRRYILTNRG